MAKKKKSLEELIEENKVCDNDAEELLNFARELKELKDIGGFEGLKKLSKEEKVAYVKRQEQDREHHCHWPGCKKQVPPAMWGCYPHWMKLPKYLRDKIWAAYKPGQEKTLTPSREYVKVAREVQKWIKENS